MPLHWPGRRKSKGREQPAQQNDGKPTAENRSAPWPNTQPAQKTSTQTGPVDGLASSAPLESAPLGSHAIENEEITKIWAEVQDRVRQLSAREDKEINDGLEH
ncbi:hypothetical protein N7456_009275 [Penicillium angulare]|uniref:Uncharacterized protein n=1 Tax=Penicillium angulare TaxID=116970 RepID=A0A9W9F4E7_9EURO|nr:hypothetical protein N7456_009275 [Penicillium angulare]